MDDGAGVEEKREERNGYHLRPGCMVSKRKNECMCLTGEKVDEKKENNCQKNTLHIIPA